MLPFEFFIQPLQLDLHPRGFLPPAATAVEAHQSHSYSLFPAKRRIEREEGEDEDEDEDEENAPSMCTVWKKAR